MFNPTKSHEQNIKEGQYSIRIGNRVPEDAVNLAYSYTPPLNPKQNIQITDMSSFILENISERQNNTVYMYPDEASLLRTERGEKYIDAQSFLITNVFKDEEPLYYVYRTKYKTIDSNGPDVYGYYKGTSISLVNRADNELPPNYKYIISLEETEDDDIYDIVVYTNFQTKPSDEIKIIYTAVEYDESISRYRSTPGHIEMVSPQRAFTENKNLLKVVSENNLSYYKGNGKGLGQSKIYVPFRPIPEETYRASKSFHYKLNVIVRGVDQTYHIQTPWIYDTVLHPDSISGYDEYYDNNGFKQLTEGTAKDMIANIYPLIDETIISGAREPVQYFVETSNPEVEVYTQPDGQGMVTATTNVNTGNMLPLSPDSYIRQEVLVNVPIRLRFHWINRYTDETYPIEAREPLDTEVNKDELEKELLHFTFNTLTYPEEPGDYDLVISYEDVETTDATVWIKDKDGNILNDIVFSVQDEEGEVYRKVNNDVVTLRDDQLDNDFYIYGETSKSMVYYNQMFALRLNGSSQVQVLHPTTNDAQENWYIKVKNGQFSRNTISETGLPTAYYYSLPEYYKQDFDNYFGMPYRKVEEERPRIIGDHKIKVRNTPLHVENLENGERNIAITVNNTPVNIVSWSVSDGTIEIDANIKKNDNIEVTYYYEELMYHYRGYWDEERKTFIHLDLNPGYGHTYTDIDKNTNEVRDLPSFNLINQTVYLYMQPNALLRLQDGIASYAQLSKGSYQDRVLFHTFEEIDDPYAMLIGQIQVRPNSSIDSLQIRDVRSRGGGLKPDISKDLMNELVPESMFYWDIGYWDGEPYSENGIIVVQLPTFILKEHGGIHKRKDVEQIVKRHLGYGIMYIIEYVDEPKEIVERPNGISGRVIDM